MAGTVTPKEPPRFVQQRARVFQLLKDRKNALPGISSFKDFAELGPVQGDAWPFNAEFIKRNFGRPVDPENPDSEYVEVLRGASHALIETRLVELKRLSYRLWAAINEMFPLDTGGDRDYDFYAEKARNGNSSAQLLVYHVDLGIDLLTRLMAGDALIAQFAHARMIRDREANEERNRALVDEYEMAKNEMAEKDAAFAVAATAGISVSRLREIAQLVREERGEPKRGRGRPKKEAAG